MARHLARLRECPVCRAHRLIVTSSSYQCRECYAEFFSRGQVQSMKVEELMKIKILFDRLIEGGADVFELTRRVTDAIDSIQEEIGI